MKPLHALLPALLALGAAAFADEAARTPEHDYDPPRPGGYTLPVIKLAADGALLDSQGKATSLKELTRGRVTVLSFIYTRCADVKACPYATGVLLNLHATSRDDAALARGMRLVSMSFDPEHDTPERLRAYAALADSPKPAAEWRFVTAPSREALSPVLEAYGQAVAPKKNAADPLGPLNHNLRVFLVDAAGRVRNIYSSGTLDARLVLADVRTLLLEDKEPLTPEAAALRDGEEVSVTFTVESTARVSDITEPGVQRPLELLLLDARNGDEPLTPTERAGVIVRIPKEALANFNAGAFDELARRLERKRVIVTGAVAARPHPARHDGGGKPRLRAEITVTRPEQIQLH